MAKRALGRFAKAQLEALRLAEAYQGLAMMNIAREFSAESDELTLENLTLERYLEELESAERNNTQDEFEEKLARLIAPAIDQVLSAPQEQG